MKAGPIFAMIGLVVVGIALVLQPTLSRGQSDHVVKIGAMEIGVEQVEGGVRFTEPASLAELGVVTADEYVAQLRIQKEAWNARPAFERTLLGFFNITSWTNFAWVAVGLLGQVAFFGRMFIQWVVSEKSRKSQVPELFWWFSFIGGLCLFTYFVWRTDVVGVLGQSTGVVVYARNLRLIKKEKRRERRRAAEAEQVDDLPPDDAGPEVRVVAEGARV